MGCGASSEDNSAKSSEDNENVSNKNNNRVSADVNIDDAAKESPVKSSEDNNNQQPHKSKSNTKAMVPKPVAFEVELETSPQSDVLLKKPPKRLQKLAPLENAPMLTAWQLHEKIRIAEEKREQQLEKKKSTARRTAKLREQILEARQSDTRPEDVHNEIIQKQMSADRNRGDKLKQLEKKKQKREERARRNKERATQMKLENGENIDFEVEKDEAYNADDADSWLDGVNPTTGTLQQEHTSEHLYSGRESPRKPILVRSNTTDKRGFSASTSDSFDYAFQRKPNLVPIDPTKHDDFFDS